MIKKRIIIILIFFLFTGINNSFSKDPGFEFLRTELGARPAGLAGAFVAVDGDLNGLFYNPAGLASIPEKVGTFTYINHLMDINAGVVGYAHPLAKKGVIAVGIHYFNYGDFEGKDTQGNDTGVFGANDFSMTLSYSLQVKDNTKAGVSGKFINSNIENYSARAFAIDLGVIHTIEKHKLNIGLSLINIGSATKGFIETKESLPSQIKAGISKELAHLPIMLSAEIRRFSDNNFQYAGGGEISLHKKVKARLGYNSEGQDQHFGITDDSYAGFSFGLGLEWSKFILDYSISSMGGIGNLNRFTITRTF
ncbi:PorV/PorQ family protein [candidate division KSB1 bacterium]